MRAAAVTAALDLLFPPRCVACGTGTAERTDRDWCDGCRSDLGLFDRPVCPRCSTPLASPASAADDCPACRQEKWRFDRVVALGGYDGLLRRLILEAKKPAGEAGAEALGRLLARRHAQAWTPPSVVVPVPSHWRRRLARRADGVGAMAGSLAAAVGLPIRRAIYRTRPTPRQTEVAPSDRQANVRRAFGPVRWPGIEGRTVLLVDDVFTTGATCNAAALALRRAGAGRVIVVVAAKRLGSL